MFEILEKDWEPLPISSSKSSEPELSKFFFENYVEFFYFSEL